MKNFGMSESRSNKTKGIDMDKCKIRSWLKDDFSTLAKYLNNANQQLKTSSDS